MILLIWICDLFIYTVYFADLLLFMYFYCFLSLHVTNTNCKNSYNTMPCRKQNESLQISITAWMILVKISQHSHFLSKYLVKMRFEAAFLNILHFFCHFAFILLFLIPIKLPNFSFSVQHVSWKNLSKSANLGHLKFLLQKMFALRNYYMHPLAFFKDGKHL